MVTIDEISDSAMVAESANESSILASEERLQDAIDIERVLDHLTRPTARMHLESLIKKLKKESEALQRVEKNRDHFQQSTSGEKHAETSMDIDMVENNSAISNAKPPPPAASTTLLPNYLTAPVPHKLDPLTAPSSAALSPTAMYKPIDRYSFDAGGYNAPFVTVYVPLPGVGVKVPRDNVTCDFTKNSFDLKVQDLDGISYRLFRDCLEKDIDASTSKIIVKAEKVIVKLAKVSTQYGGYDYWTKLVDTKKQKVGGSTDAKKSDDPQSSIMELMKEMYDSGDDNMKKIIGETMMKQQRGELGKDNDFGKGLDHM
jgi:calcyclin binding protein